MFRFFKKKKPQSVSDKMILIIYGSPPAAKRTDVGQTVSLANELLMHIISEIEVITHATELDKNKFNIFKQALSL